MGLIINVLGLIREEPGPWRGSKLMVESQEHSLYYCEGRRITCIKFLLSSKLGAWNTLLLSKLESLSPEDVSCQVRLKAHVEKSLILPIISPWKHFSHSVCLILEATARDFIWLCLQLPPRLSRGSVRIAFGRAGFDPRSRQTQVVKSGSDSSTAKRSATGVTVTGPSSEMTIINGRPVSQ